MKNNAEVNDEQEFTTNNINTFRNFVKYIGFVKFIDKIKEIHLFHYKNISLELVYIHKLGYFIEAEGICKNKKDADNIIQIIDQILFTELNLHKNSIENKMYIELLLAKT